MPRKSSMTVKKNPDWKENSNRFIIFINIINLFNSLAPSAPFIHLLKTSENLTVNVDNNKLYS